MLVRYKPLPETSFGRLRPITADPAAARIVGFDTEDNSHGIPLSFAFHDGQKGFYTTSAREAVRFIYAQPETTVFVAHNLEYDLGNLFKSTDFVYIDAIIENSKILRCSIKGSKNFFLNSSAFFPGKLSRMGEMIGLPKLHGDVFDKAYNIRDAEIVQKFVSKFQQRVIDKWGVSLGVTIGQMSMACFRKNYLPDPVVTYNGPNCLSAYYGGRVEAYRLGIIPGPVIVSDIKSCYPTVMRSYDYPDSATMERSRLETHDFGIGEFTVLVPKDTPVPPLPLRSQGKRLFFPVGTFSGWWTYAEIRAAQETVPGFRILTEKAGEGTQHAARPFVQFVDDFYSERQAWQKKLKKDPADAEAKFEVELLKLFLNNLYGKMAQKIASKMLVRDRLSENHYIRKRMPLEGYLAPFYQYKAEQQDDPAGTANYIWGIHVTSYARIYLREKMLQVVNAGGRLIYCDTDSIMYAAPAGWKTPLDIGNNLGQLDEEVFDLGIFRQAKGYLLCNRGVWEKQKGKWEKQGDGKEGEFTPIKLACKGVPTSHAVDFVLGGMARYRKPFRLKEALIRVNARGGRDLGEGIPAQAEIAVNAWHDVEKAMRSTYIKRLPLPDGSTRAVDADEIPGLEEGCHDNVESIQTTVKEMGLRIHQKPHVELFGDAVIPVDWFKRDIKIPTGKVPEGCHVLKPGECSRLGQGDVWFSGWVESCRIIKNKPFLIVMLYQYLGEIVIQSQMRAAFSSRFIIDFDKVTKNISGKFLQVSMLMDYISNSDLSVKVCITKTRGRSPAPHNQRKNHG